MIVTITPRNISNSKNITIGIKYTKAGVVCIASSIGLKILFTVSLLALQIQG